MFENPAFQPGVGEWQALTRFPVRALLTHPAAHRVGKFSYKRRYMPALFSLFYFF